MRAKRSKKYRKLMHQYELTFGFREPYQVLVDSNFLRAVHSFKMDLIPALERTLQGKVKPLLTKCSLAAVMASQPTNPKTQTPYRPAHLPPPTELPLRHCSHNEDSDPIDETSCLLSLFSPSPNPDSKKNKEHYILATADPPAPEKVAASSTGDAKKRMREVGEAEEGLRRAKALRVAARSVPGVPVVYVKRSVMILESMSTTSEDVREGFERGKFRAGIEGDSSLGKRKRGADNGKNRKGGVKKAKGPNPLSVKKPKKRANESATPGESKWQKGGDADETKEDTVEVAERQKDGESAALKQKRKRRHHKSAKQVDDGTGIDETPAESME